MKSTDQLSRSEDPKLNRMNAGQSFQRILGINFFVGELPELLELCSKGKFVVVPAAPTLAELPVNAAYRASVEQSDFAITDSAFMVVIWNALTGQKVTRISGLKLLRGLLSVPGFGQPGASLWVMPSREEQKVNLAWLNQHGCPVTAEECLVAPMYPEGPIRDKTVLDWVEKHQAPYIIINLGGGVQERLGHYLKNHLSYRPSIICVGAAIAFISGLQASIPVWADEAGLGWLFRVIHSPARFIPRYWRALRLVGLMVKYRDRGVTE